MERDYSGYSDLLTGEPITNPYLVSIGTDLGRVVLVLQFGSLRRLEKSVHIMEFDLNMLEGKKVFVEKAEGFISSEYDEAFKSGDPARLSELFFGKHGYWGKANWHKFHGVTC